MAHFSIALHHAVAMDLQVHVDIIEGAGDRAGLIFTASQI